MQFGIPRRSNEAKTDEPTPVNWRRGLLRLWLLVSAAWVMAWCIFYIMDAVQGGFKTSGEVFAVPVVLFGPPIAILVLGLAARWVFRGFKVDGAWPDG